MQIDTGSSLETQIDTGSSLEMQIDTGSSLEEVDNNGTLSREVHILYIIIGMHSMHPPSQIGSSRGVICSVDPIDAYMHQLQQYNAIATCDDSLRMFVVQDFSPASLSLKVNTSKCLRYAINIVFYLI